MAVNVMIPTPLRPYVNDQETVLIDGETVGDVLTVLSTQYPELKKHLFDESGQLRKFVNIYVKDEDIRDQQGVDTSIPEGADMLIVPSIAGGL